MIGRRFKKKKKSCGEREKKSNEKTEGGSQGLWMNNHYSNMSI